MEKVFSAALLLLLATSLFVLELNITLVSAIGVIYIRANGAIDPPTPQISTVDNITYNLVGDLIGFSIVIERSNIVFNGNGHKLRGQGTEFGSGDGIVCWSGLSNLTIMNVNVENFDKGIRVFHSSFCTVFSNNVTENGWGLLFQSSSNDTIFDNNLHANVYNGITFQFSNYSRIFGNRVTDNGQHGIDLDNYCNHDSVINNCMTNNSYSGILVAFSSYNNVSDNFVAGPSDYGISCQYSASSNMISGNNITNCTWGGSFYAALGYICSNNTLAENNLLGNYQGISLYNAIQNTVARNNMSGNDYGIWSQDSSLNSIFHNNLANNTWQVDGYNSHNTLDDGYPEGGNFWSNYTNKTDNFRGAYQNITGSDGIADAGLTVPSTSEEDKHPLMGPFGSQTVKGTNVTVFPEDEVCLIFENVTSSGSTTANKTTDGLPPLPGYVPVGSYYDVKVSAAFSGTVMIRIIYNDTGLTPEQEMSLQLSQWNATGDVDFSGKVDLKDVFAVGRAFGAILVDGTFLHMPTRSCCPHSANADLNGDGRVDLKDYYKTCKQFGKAAAWVDITIYVDTENNVIYGETDHFSGIGIHRAV